MLDMKLIALSTLYVVLAMVLVSLSGTYAITNKLFGKLVGASDPKKYGMGMKLTEPGFLLHIIVFALLVAVPMFLSKR